MANEFNMSEKAQEIYKQIEEFCEKEVKQQAMEADAKEGDILDIIEKASKLGFNALDVPKEFGGIGLSKMDSVALLEKMSWYDAGFGITISANGLASGPVVIGGNDEQKKKMYDIILNGGIGAFCLTERNAGCDASAGESRAVRDGDDYIINGKKCFITNGPIASYYVVFAMTAPEKGAGKGYTAFLIDKKVDEVEGMSIGLVEDKMGIRNSQVSEVLFDNVRVPASMRIGEEGQGFKLAMMTLDIARITCGITAVGICQRALDEAVEYAKNRVQFGTALANNEVIQFKIADMQMHTAAARELCKHATELYMKHLPFSSEAAMAKCVAGDAAAYVTSEAVQIFGGYGFMHNYPVEKLMRDSKIFQIFEGSNEIQRLVIGRNALR
ncbi:MAG: acyl-CoA dehydrogenase family protein [Eubacterium sp.]|nr:acyl-CoA dehydrogenase family protein [Eubacterium sp.]